MRPPMHGWESHSPSSYASKVTTHEWSEDTAGHGPPILVAQSAVDGSVYAVEEIRTGVYALCKLGSWVKAGDIQLLRQNRAAVRLKSAQTTSRGPDDGRWWDRAAVQQPPGMELGTKRPTHRSLSMTRPAFEVTEICSAATPSPALSPPAYEAAQIIDVSQMVTSPVVKPLPEPFEQSSAQEVTQTIVAQYLETLYLSKTSLAYFSKGPLSRARAAFSTGIESSPQLSDLIVFLRSMVLTLSVMDKKYRTKLPDTILAFPANNPSEDEHIAARTTRNRNPKKLKLSKEGMFPSEAEYIKRWWSVDDGTPSQATPIEARDQALRRRIGDLRIRESLLQTIIILEILSLEAAMSPRVHTISADVDTQMQGQAGVERKKRPKKPLDLILLVDLLIDKLCIWQSLEQEASTAKKGDEKNSKNTTEGVDAQTGSSDRLRSFCVEVIIPL
ncbi:hypothetical protein LTR04_003987 [Oleoguttula sp. CCFEE 6159]|nr:hypothetical protein LTR04_003987 [Oleoguttula sp. CCFEE 6159]